VISFDWEGASVFVQIHRSIPDGSECEGQVWWGSLDLSQGSGEVTVDDDDLLCVSNEAIREECEAWQGYGVKLLPRPWLP